jgi:hypothetical protein
LFKNKSEKVTIPKNSIRDYLGRGFSGDVFGYRGRISSFQIENLLLKETIIERKLVQIQDKYIDCMIEELKQMKGKNSWTITISKVMKETANFYELEMEDEIREAYEEDN